MTSRGQQPWELTGEALESLLTLLDDDREQAAHKYEQIRRRLVQLFLWRGSRVPEELADETINRVARKLGEGLEIQSEDPYRYFCGVAHLVFKELLRRDQRQRRSLQEIRHHPMPEPATPDTEERLVCLERCLAKLERGDRELILQFYRGEKSRRISRRKDLAARLGISVNALRVRAHRLRAKLETCTAACLESTDLGDPVPGL